MKETKISDAELEILETLWGGGGSIKRQRDPRAAK